MCLIALFISYRVFQSVCLHNIFGFEVLQVVFVTKGLVCDSGYELLRWKLPSVTVDVFTQPLPNKCEMALRNTLIPISEVAAE